MEFYNFGSLGEAREYFVCNKIRVCGVEIDESARSIVEHPFVGDTVFILGNEVYNCIFGYIVWMLI